MKELEKRMNEGKIGSIGVSNHTIEDIEHMKKYYKIRPSVNQIEFHPFIDKK